MLQKTKVCVIIFSIKMDSELIKTMQKDNAEMEKTMREADSTNSNTITVRRANKHHMKSSSSSSSPPPPPPPEYQTLSGFNIVDDATAQLAQAHEKKIRYADDYDDDDKNNKHNKGPRIRSGQPLVNESPYTTTQKITSDTLLDQKQGKCTRYKRHIDHYDEQDKIPYHIEDFMNRKQYIEEPTMDEAEIYLKHLEEKWLPPIVEKEEIRHHMYYQWGMSEESNSPDPATIERRYKQNIFQILRIMSIFFKHRQIGNIDDETQTNSTRFSRILEVVKTYRDSLINEHRLLGLHQNTGNIRVPERVSLFQFRFIDYSNNSQYQNLIIFLLQELHKKNYRKMGDSCYCQEKSSQGFLTHSWKRVCTIKEFIYQSVDKETNFEQWANLTSSKSNVHEAATYLTNSVEFEFPTLIPSRYVFSFDNGLYYVDKDEFHPYDTDPQPSTIVSCNYFKDYFDWDTYKACADDPYSIPTLTLQKILDDQELDKSCPEDNMVTRVFYTMVGRLLYEVGKKDNWQVLLYIKGVAQSGKSTIGDLIRTFYRAEDVGTISSNMERKFGLSALIDKKLAICSEVSKNFAMSQVELQSAITGESMSIAVKNKTAYSTQWTVPMIFLGNVVGNWLDNSGSMLRRMLLFEFPNSPARPDPTLALRLRKELPAIICKCNKMYLSTVGEIKDRSLWDRGSSPEDQVLPEYFHTIRKQFATDINPLDSFMENSDNLVYDEKHYMPWEEFWTMYREYEKLHALRTVRNTSSPDFYNSVFKRRGVIATSQEELQWEGQPKKCRWIRGVTIVGHEDTGHANDNANEYLMSDVF